MIPSEILKVLGDAPGKEGNTLFWMLPNDGEYKTGVALILSHSGSFSLILKRLETYSYKNSVSKYWKDIRRWQISDKRLLEYAGTRLDEMISCSKWLTEGPYCFIGEKIHKHCPKEMTAKLEKLQRRCQLKGSVK
jgi:hypothetical protein